MATRFVGRFEHSLDAKGRVILPAKFRPPFEHGAYLSEYHDGCLALWTPEEFEREMTGRLDAAARGPTGRQVMRVWAAGSEEVEVDRQGRMPIANHLRQFARLAEGVLVNGAIDHIELWDPPTWEVKIRPAERLLRDGEETGGP